LGHISKIKNPDVIHDGQKPKIPPEADLTKKEKSAVHKYRAKNCSQTLAAKPKRG